MYEAFFGLREKPFNMTPDPRYFYPSIKHVEALNHMAYAVEQRRGFVVLTGEIGSGKTTVSRVLLSRLKAPIKTAVIRNTHLTAKDLISRTLDEFEVAYTPGTKTQLLDQLNAYLIDQLRAGANVVLLVDEAQNLSPRLLEEIRMLSNLETDQEKLIQIVLMGQPELKGKLWLRSLTQFRQRVTVYYHLTPLDVEETAAYIHHRLRVAGANGSPAFTDTACRGVFEHSHGIPRLINALCDHALLTGYVNESKIIDQDVIDEVATELPSLTEAPVAS
ncbi:MAG: AAA family ATPase [Candidatus Omnitrophica bacterium]|nr:AAA family ATPase [Candidatus Omnitrophota bacterium]